MIFEVDNMWITMSLDHREGRIYVEMVRNEDLDNPHNMNLWMDTYVNPSVDGILNYCSIKLVRQNWKHIWNITKKDG